MSKTIRYILITFGVLIIGSILYFVASSTFSIMSIVGDVQETMRNYKKTNNEIVLYDKENLQKKVVFDNDSTTYLVHFWATWCRPCIAEFDTIQKYHKNWKNVELYMVTYEDSTKLNAFLKDKKWNLPFYRVDSLNVPFQPTNITYYPSNFIFYKDTLTVGVGPVEWGSFMRE